MKRKHFSYQNRSNFSQVLDDMTNMFRMMEGGKLAERADDLKDRIPDMVDLDRADNLADVFGKHIDLKFVGYIIKR